MMTSIWHTPLIKPIRTSMNAVIPEELNVNEVNYMGEKISV